MNNRIHNSSNPHQGAFKKVLCVCSAGLLRSPTIAWVLSQEPYEYNTRAVGLDKNYALIPMDDVLLHWADEIVCAEADQSESISRSLELFGIDTRVVNLNLPDSYDYRDPELVHLIKRRYLS